MARSQRLRNLYALVLSALSGLACMAAASAMAADSHEELMGWAHAAIKASGVVCTPTDARRAWMIGEGRSAGRLASHRESGARGSRKDGGAGPGGFASGLGGQGLGSFVADRPMFVEVACAEGLGYLIPMEQRPQVSANHDVTDRAASTAPKASPTQFMNCLEAGEASSKGVFPLHCELKANADQRAALQSLATHLGVECTIEAARGMGHNEALSFFEIACVRSAAAQKAGVAPIGYVIAADRAFRADHANAVMTCFETQGHSKLQCQLTHVDQIVAALHRFVTKNDAACAVRGQRLLGLTREGDQVFETACVNGKGYLAVRRDKDVFTDLIACDAPAAARACRLTRFEGATGDRPSS